MAAMMAAVAVGGCAGPSDDSEPDATPSATASARPDTDLDVEPRLMPDAADAALRAELLAMFERDQSGRTGGPDDEGDRARTTRLAEIVTEVGWPTESAVGEDGATAAWTIAQHSDLDLDFQRIALAHLEFAVAEGEGSPGNLAYLTDRVAAGAGEPQTYGTQITCTPGGAEPAPPLADPDAVDELRAAAGLPPLADYLAETAALCAAEE